MSYEERTRGKRRKRGEVEEEENRRPSKGFNSKICHQPILYQYYILFLFPDQKLQGYY